MKDDSTPDKRQKLNREGQERKPYKKPAFRHERVFETAALSCGKVYSVQSTCISSKKTS
jgi:hypothetical protein